MHTLSSTPRALVFRNFIGYYFLKVIKTFIAVFYCYFLRNGTVMQYLIIVLTMQAPTKTFLKNKW
jgi:hypothetical protein